MEAEIEEDGDENHLSKVLSENELACLPRGITDKINAYIDTKFEEYLTSKTPFDGSKAQLVDKIATSEATVLELTAKYEETAKMLIVADDTVAEPEKQVETLRSELSKANYKIVRLENEIISLKSARNAAIDEKNYLTQILERRDSEIQSLTANETLLSQRLRDAIDSKCKALASYLEIQSKELSLQYREKRIEQERTVLNSQISILTKEVNRLNLELRTQKRNSTSRLISIEKKLSKNIEELNAANETITQLNKVKKNLNSRAKDLTKRLVEQREAENKISENYKKELDTKTKLVDSFKTMVDDGEAKATKLVAEITDLKKNLKEATEKYGELEIKYKQAELDHEQLLEKKNDVITSLKSEIEHANDLLKAAAAHNLDTEPSDVAPSEATASKALKSGMSLTQIYSQLVKVTDELSNEKEENRQLNITIKTIIQELEEKAPILQKQKTDYEKTLESNTALIQKIDSLKNECNRLRDGCSESSKILNHHTKENAKLKGELADLGRQVCFLLKEIEHSRGGLINSDTSHSTNTSSSDLNSSPAISETLVTFNDIQELQSNNQKLLRMVRELTDKKEELERNKKQVESEEIEALKNRLLELTEAQDRQIKMLNGLIKQRDMFKKLYHNHMKGKSHKMSSVLDTSELVKSDSLVMETKLPDKPVKPEVAQAAAYEMKYIELEKQHGLLKEENKTYKELKVTNERMLYEQIENMRQEIVKLTAANSKYSSTSEHNNESLKILQTNIMTCKKQISTLEEKNKAYHATIARNEVSLQYLRDDALNAQSKLAAAEIQLENLKLECKFLRDSELRLQMENEVRNRERQGQTLLLKNLELIKRSVENFEAENRTKFQPRLEETTRESALRRRLQEEQDSYRELASHLECLTETAKRRIQEKSDTQDLTGKEITRLVPVLTSSATSAASVAPATAAATPATREDAATSASSASSVPPEFTQMVALVMPRIEQSSGGSSSVASAAPTASSPAHSVSSQAAVAAPATSQSATSATPMSAAGVQTSSGVSTSHPPIGVSTLHKPSGVSTSHAAPGVSTSNAPSGSHRAGHSVQTFSQTSHAQPNACPQKRHLQTKPVIPKRTRVQGCEKSVEVDEYPVATSSRCEQNDEIVIILVDSEADDELHTGSIYSPPSQSPEAREAGEAAAEGSLGKVDTGAALEAREADSEPTPQHQQIEPITISSDTELTGALPSGGSGGDDSDDSIVVL